MTTATLSPARYEISFTVRDEDYKFDEHCFKEFDHEPTEDEAVLAVAEFCDFDREEASAALAEYREDRTFWHTDAVRLIEDICWNRVTQHSETATLSA